MPDEKGVKQEQRDYTVVKGSLMDKWSSEPPALPSQEPLSPPTKCEPFAILPYILATKS